MYTFVPGSLYYTDEFYQVARGHRNALTPKAHYDFLLYTKLIPFNSEGAGSSLDDDQPASQALEGACETSRCS